MSPTSGSFNLCQSVESVDLLSSSVRIHRFAPQKKNPQISQIYTDFSRENALNLSFVLMRLPCQISCVPSGAFVV